MRLKQLKLAGFKSFVDPTIVPFPSQLVAVVGPNGCGKSNVIDAVRWVMGESSAKNLRGESMIDVIFNGSSQRKPVGQASVELVFDNSLGKLAGQYASYQEISVKRVVTRDGDSSYYLNNSRCRRKDITDIFLGTGAGTKGYSIIGQGTISRIVEARPEELRAFLEEAAGVSKYKERRKETKLRIEHTRENLARVADIREELDKQLQRLDRQAKAANRYKELKTKEHLYKAEVLAFKWQAVTEEQKTKKEKIHYLAMKYEEHQARATDAYKQSVQLREILQDKNEAFQNLQAIFYQIATEIARLEENINLKTLEKKRLLDDKSIMQEEWQQSEKQLKDDAENLVLSVEMLANLDLSLKAKEREFKLLEETFSQQEKEESEWNLSFEQNQKTIANLLREIELQKLKLEHLRANNEKNLLRIEKLHNELNNLGTENLNLLLDEEEEKQNWLEEAVKESEERYQECQANNNLLREKARDNENALHQEQDAFYKLNLEKSKLEALQTKDLIIPDNEKLQKWTAKPRLIETIKAKKEWQFAAELVLEAELNAIVLDSMEPLWQELADLRGGNLLFLSAKKNKHEQVGQLRLVDVIENLPLAMHEKLTFIYLKDSLNEAIALVPQLEPHESVISQDGFWLAKDWVKVAKADDAVTDIGFEFYEKLEKLKEEIEQSESKLHLLKETRQDLLELIKENEDKLAEAKESLNFNQDQLRAIKADIQLKRKNIEDSLLKKKSVEDEIEELNYGIAELKEEELGLADKLMLLEKDFLAAKDIETSLNDEKTIFSNKWQDSKNALNQARVEFHQNQLDVDRERLKIQQLQANQEKDTRQLALLEDKLQQLTERFIELEEPDSSLKTNLEEKIGQHQEYQDRLNIDKEQLNELGQQFNQLEILIRDEEREAKAIQEQSQTELLQEQALKSRGEGFLESLHELNEQVENLLANIPAGLTQELRERDLQDIVDKIKQLGAINLAAIEEYESENARKIHLDEQYNDLMEAMAVLETAIDKMDRETESRFKATFSEVNQRFQSLFPRLFGGGKALLELTSDNLLDAGVMVMAQPPGKRNSTIHLLSGGEKAMTAVALVFAIFQLNPSPFCMLDEVDAPLDDLNVGRFCEIVKEMSSVVQFLFITHNKVTMELADHLIGVTMREPGVSRIVAVDVEQALTMSES